MKKRIFFLLLSLIFPILCYAELRFRLWLTSKAGTPYTIENPGAYLSERAIERRFRQRIGIDSTDLPVNPAFISQVRTLGATPVVCSKWLNTLVVTVPDSSYYESLTALPFVRKAELVWKGTLSLGGTETPDSGSDYELERRNTYGAGRQQIQLHGGDRLHKAGFTGNGMEIAILDAGFCRADRNPAIPASTILGTYDFVCPGKSVYEANKHGAMVLSVMAARDEGRFIGSAPDAGYWLIRTEDTRSEFPIEEDFWTAGIEFADSVGVDVVTSSLGYTTYDLPELSHNIGDLDGRTTLISRAAHKGSEKGMIVLNSAGNEGESSWGKIIFPADAPGVLTVGAIDNDRVPTDFSGWGFTADNRVKPDVVAIGAGTAMIATDGKVNRADGTSFSTPLMAGLVACLWQALPHLGASEIVELIRKSASQYFRPDRQRGYGISDVYKIYQEQKQ